ncbi:mannose-6-phosphate isomerase [Citrobacter rodentium]|uniref:Mannose-6-phosphate isomerase n=2 Tax=Citrobacter rodentium TaxID=67825 RepID=D2THM0_CITRI|nr:mannose-6-phosphate isomerase [Citrobacter rodentium]KIQ48664.1 mannose-6-phosphate isomerase [Citrobacter rodentium]QBY28049.1 mannose-6-phosphate isomerase [Citrobacter rodentium]UHO30071.1 mannose-6-phosphate isomerase [Citrobacter rodentium NBRC 105723 = DSM 16636]CBG88214.1 mannose-6-phosphate isomerase [Citrobacter rodentium ICC168]HAT8011423.1 mannose-6-phosphate isomerase [Citrobacter rodentium NBRC 105723 = DSM 16636]
MQKLINSVQNYAWGSKTALTELYGIANPQQLPMAELWMGAHPKSSSQVVDASGQRVSLRDVIEADKSRLLGDAVARRFGELPFLFKVLCAAQPLSIQVHPNKRNSELGFAKENVAGIPMDAAERNYKDPNHKPELVFALTPFLAMNAFREFSEIVSLLQPVAGAHTAIAHFLEAPDAERLSALFAALLNMQGEEKSRALAILKAALETQSGEPWQTIRLIGEFYPDDSGLFSPLLLNVVKLNPGEAMFLFAETPHAYLQGVALEVMANSDNVLRAGLTPKYIDIPELVANVKFEAKPADRLLTAPLTSGAEQDFPIPVDDFAFSLHDLSAQQAEIAQQSAAILFCVEGEATLRKGEQSLTLKPGESAFISAAESPVSVSGAGRLARVYNKL